MLHFMTSRWPSLTARLRLASERQIGYKQATPGECNEITDGCAKIAGSNGGHREDRGYKWCKQM